MLTTLHLSQWLDWTDRPALPDCFGVYVIAKSEVSNVIYVGRTWGNGGLRKRISAFNRSATTGASGHAGGVTYNGTFGTDVDDLLICYHQPIVIHTNPGILRPYIEYAERRLIWEHVEKHGELPACNSE